LVGRPLHVVTNSLPPANLFAADNQSDLVLIGGNICSRTGVALRPYANGMLAKVRVQRTVLSLAGVNEEGFSDNIEQPRRERLQAAGVELLLAEADDTQPG
jgi:DeoR/GlpR family transcriptional regulator of sugar metabolism